MDLLTAAGRRGKGAERGKRTLARRIKKKLCGIHNSSLEMNVFVFSFALNFALKLTSENFARIHRFGICFNL